MKVSSLKRFMRKLISNLMFCRLSVWWLGLAFCAALLVIVPGTVLATTVNPPTFTQLVNESDYIVRAVVKSVTSEWRENQGPRHIFTFVELDVREVIAGNPPQPLILQMLGGKVGDEELTVSGAPKFQVGDEDVLFIQGNGRNISPLIGIMHVRYPVMKEKGTGREFITRSNQVPLQDTAEVALPMAEGPAAAMQLRMKNEAQALTPVEVFPEVLSRCGSGLPRVSAEPAVKRNFFLFVFLS